MKRKILNVSCVACSKPLLAFILNKRGELSMQSYGCSIERGLPKAHALCDCGGRSPFNGNLLPQPGAVFDGNFTV